MKQVPFIVEVFTKTSSDESKLENEYITDLLDLRSDAEFSSQFPNLKIVTPVGFLEMVRAI